MVYMRFERGHITVTTGCADRELGHNFSALLQDFRLKQTRPPSILDQIFTNVSVAVNAVVNTYG
jgi:hypothetical protein